MKTRILPFALLLTAGAVFAPGPTTASHADGDYEIPLFFEWGTSHMVLDTIFVPPGHGQIFNNAGLFGGNIVSDWDQCTGTYTRALLDSIENWRVAINTFGSAHLKTLDINVWIAGCDPTSSMPTDPEIIVYLDDYKGPVLGFALTNMPDTDHCVVNNGKFGTVPINTWNYEDMFNVMGQEFGHCLGLGHTGDVSGAPAGAASHPSHDTMEGQYEHSIGVSGTHRHCNSNLNVLALEAVFDNVSNPNQIIEMAVGSYALATNPLCNSVLIPGGG